MIGSCIICSRIEAVLYVSAAAWYALFFDGDIEWSVNHCGSSKTGRICIRIPMELSEFVQLDCQIGVRSVLSLDISPYLPDCCTHCRELFNQILFVHPVLQGGIQKPAHIVAMVDKIGRWFSFGLLPRRPDVQMPNPFTSSVVNSSLLSPGIFATTFQWDNVWGSMSFLYLCKRMQEGVPIPVCLTHKNT